MKLKTVMSWSDGYTDEVQSNTLALGFANKQIADLNTTFNLKLGFIENVDTDYGDMNDSWFVRFMLPALSYGIKMNDGSLTEAREYKNILDRAMYDFEGVEKSTVIAEDKIVGDSGTTYMIDTSNAIDIGWFNSGNSGWGGL